ncbi:MAG: hypothetical protein HN617_09645 [Planctomycetaceae bacterium]|jgi:hypothetical protein|nr:hypothetical protein [Planctomycetaceae bacterium]MBT4723352.1 hypothetical protein [Planctomycetaceae bacterium]MBT5126113.1 hypothetical protein [Planctomycetaceae bacterium]MBT5883209.1 hypothetical protein [Planctomycetaceae bacterium]MBT6846702.1 hypothetical protein [Planctomycetaceae bacterium]
MMIPRSFAPMIMLASCWAVGFFLMADKVIAIETAATTTVADVLYWSWNKGDVYDVQMQTKTKIHLKQGQQELEYHSTTTIDGVLVVQSLSAQSIAEIHWTVRRIRLDNGAGKKRISIDSAGQLAADELQPVEKSLLASLRPLLAKTFVLRIDRQATLLGVQELKRQSAVAADQNNVQPKLDVDEPLFTAGGVKAAFRHVFVSFPKGELEFQTIWQESKNPLSSPMNNPVRFQYQYRGLKAERGHVVGIIGKYAFADSGEQSKVLKIDQEQISGKLVTDAGQNYVKRVDLELLLKTTAGQGTDAIITEQSDIQSIAIAKK